MNFSVKIEEKIDQVFTICCHTKKDTGLDKKYSLHTNESMTVRPNYQRKYHSNNRMNGNLSTARMNERERSTHWYFACVIQ